MEEELLNLISDITNISSDNLTMDSGPQSIPEWDSLAQLTIVAAIESKYNISFDMNDIISIQSVNDLKKTIEKHIK